ncbi:hypothetical protein [Pseudomonas triticicola]|uniref:hypothetical protein n=1 Tax=Pseudomonas triticicola TaxID=2842345 RepID=UPI003EBD2395
MSEGVIVGDDTFIGNNVVIHGHLNASEQPHPSGTANRSASFCYPSCTLVCCICPCGKSKRQNCER